MHKGVFVYVCVCTCMHACRESVLFIGTQFSNPYTAVDTPARGRVGVCVVLGMLGCIDYVCMYVWIYICVFMHVHV